MREGLPARSGRTKTMKLFVDQLKSAPTEHTFSGSPSWWHEQIIDGRDLDHRVEEPFQFDLEAYTLTENIIIVGSLAGAIDVECGRCLERYRHSVAERFRLVLEAAGNRPPTDPESARILARDGMCLADDLEVGWYQGPEIVLDSFFSEVISLGLPMQPLCQESCKGLCPRCGTDRNRADCDCGELKPPSPFAVLAALRDGNNGGGS